MKQYPENHWSHDTDPESAIHKYCALLKGKYQSVRNEIILSQLVPPNLRGKTIMDYGCGIGYFSIQLAKRGGNVIGLDTSTEAINTARYYAAKEKVIERCSFIACHHDMSDLDNLEAFDIIFMKDVIEHIEDDRAFLSVVTKHLKSNGYMVVTTPNSFSLGHCLDVLYQRWYLGNKAYVGGADPTHVRLYSTFRLKRLMAEFGLRRRKLYAVGIFPTNVVFYATRSKYQGSYYLGFIDRIIGGVFPFSVIGTGQLNLYQKMR